MSKYKIVYSLQTNSVIQVVPYENKLSDSESKNIVARLASEFNNSKTKEEMIVSAQSIRQVIQAFASNTYTQQNIYIGTVAQATNYFDQIGVDYSGNEILNPPE